MTEWAQGDDSVRLGPVPTTAELTHSAIVYGVKRASDIHQRRLKTIPNVAWARFFGARTFDPRYYFDLTERHLHFSVYPTDELKELKRREEQFGTPFPDLFDSSSCGPSTAQVEEKGPADEMRPSGTLQSPLRIAQRPVVLMGDPNGGSTLKMISDQPFCTLHPNSHLIIQNFTLEKRTKKRRFSYRIYLTFLFGFGDKITPLNATDVLEWSLSYLIYDGAILDYAFTSTDAE